MGLTRIGVGLFAEIKKVFKDIVKASAEMLGPFFMKLKEIYNLGEGHLKAMENYYGHDVLYI